ncbi:MAG TPA: hypothetical protein VM262_06200 [Acidimicrobiales bacterium]|nr:hypothetical protein [Acidimicrobiales bacterium]
MRQARWLLVALMAILIVPLVVGIVALRRPPWYPVLDHAMAELRLRDIFSSRTPLIGLPGRIGRFPEQGSHPGPASFYALWPTWRAFGGTPWGMQAGALVLNGIAASAAVLVAFRRGGLRVAVAVTALLAVLMGGYGIETLAEPWNPYLPLLWWVLVLLSVWSVLDGDLPMLPVAVLAASIAAQTHVPYLGLCLGLAAVAGGGLVWWWRRTADEHAAAATRRSIGRWAVASVALGVLLWSPVVVDQITEDPGNLSMLWDHFTSPPQEEGETVGVVEGVRLGLRHLDVTSFLSRQGSSLGSLATSSGDAGGSILPGLVTLLGWVVAAVVAWRHRYTSINRLNVVVGSALLLGVVSMSRIFGKVWYYLMLWSWGTAALLLLSVGMTVWRVVDRERATRAVGAVLVAISVVSAGLLTVRAAVAEPPAPQLSEVLAEVVPPTAAALDRATTYLITWDDSFYIGSQGMGLLSALDRRGFRVGVTETWRVPLTPHRVLQPGEAQEEVHLAVGRFVELWRRHPDAVELAHHDPRDGRDVAEYDALRKRVITDLRAAGFPEGDIDLVDGNLFGLSIDTRLPAATRERIERMLALGSPGAVFLVPVGATLSGP